MNLLIVIPAHNEESHLPKRHTDCGFFTERNGNMCQEIQLLF